MSSRLGLLILLVDDVPRSKAVYTEYLGLGAVPDQSLGKLSEHLG